jgi:hypothetical protein
MSVPGPQQVTMLVSPLLFVDPARRAGAQRLRAIGSIDIRRRGLAGDRCPGGGTATGYHLV